jgi:hypothetical protein
MVKLGEAHILLAAQSFRISNEKSANRKHYWQALHLLQVSRSYRGSDKSFSQRIYGREEGA